MEQNLQVDNTAYNPLIGGCQLGTCTFIQGMGWVSGTAGLVVFALSDGSAHLLTCGHVVTGIPASVLIGQPAPTSADECQRVGNVGNNVSLIALYQDVDGEDYGIDCAALPLYPLHYLGRGVSARTISNAPQNVIKLLGARRPVPGDVGKTFYKRGAVTGLTSTIVLSQARPIKNPNAANSVYPNQIALDCAGHPNFAVAGDSGSVVFDQNNYAVGLLWGSASDANGTYFFASPIVPILHRLGMVLDPPHNSPYARTSDKPTPYP